MTTSDWIDLAVAIGTIGLAAIVFWQTVAEAWSRPKLSLELDAEGIQTRLEGEPPRIPWIRLVVRNARGRRAARGTRVLVEHFRERYSMTPPVSLAGPELGWPSTQLREGDGAVVFGGTARPLDFGVLGSGPAQGQTNFLELCGAHQTLPDGYQWWFRFALAMHARSVFIGREFLPQRSGGWTARLVVGADEGRARTFDVDFDWTGTVSTPAAALDSFRPFLSVTEVRSSRSVWRTPWRWARKSSRT